MKKILISLAFLSIVSLFAQKNLIKNGSFELDKDSWRGENVLTINPYIKRTGEKGGNIYEYREVDMVVLGMMLKCRIPDDHKDAYETGLAENRTSPS